MARSLTSSDKISGGTANLASAGSASFWVYPTWASTDNSDHVFMDKPTGPASPVFFRMQKYLDNNLYFGFFNNAEYRVVVASGSYTLNQNAWNNFLLAWDNSGSILYLNGSQIGTAGVVTQPNLSGLVETIGNYTFGTTTNLAARLADFSIYNAKLGSSFAAALNRGARAASLGIPLHGYWPLDGLQSPEPDFSGNANNGTLTGTALAAGPPTMPFTRRMPQFLSPTAQPSPGPFAAYSPYFENWE